MCLPFCWAPGNSLQRHCFCRGQTAGLNNKRGIKHPAWEKWSTGQTLLQRSCCRHESLMRGVSRLTWKHLHTNKPRRRSNPHLSQLRLEALLASNQHLWSNALLDLPGPIATFKSNIFFLSYCRLQRLYSNTAWHSECTTYPGNPPCSVGDACEALSAPTGAETRLVRAPQGKTNLCLSQSATQQLKLWPCTPHTGMSESSQLCCNIISPITWFLIAKHFVQILLYKFEYWNVFSRIWLWCTKKKCFPLLKQAAQVTFLIFQNDWLPP